MAAVGKVQPVDRAVYLVRHATPDWTRTDIPYHLPPGPPLTSQGIDEAGLLRSYLRRVGVRLLAASPLERCLHTAHTVADARQNGHYESAIPLETWPALTELQPGEDTASMRGRFWPAFQTAWALSETLGSLALVTHGGPVTFLLEEMGADPVRLMREFKFDHRNPAPPAGAWRITRPDPGGLWHMALVFIPSEPAWQPREFILGLS
jgi:broad specificity phosphatase PhoE